MSTTTLDAPRATADARSGGHDPSSRLTSLDFVRGVVMILMAIDHVRVYSGVPPGGPDPGVFFTRWITHFVAPAFIFLAGTAAFLHGRKLGDRAALSRFLLTRGAWLVLLELTVIRLAWTFNLDYAHYTLGGVIWVIGWCMILMSLLVRLPARAIGAFGVAIIALHNALDPLVPRMVDAASAGGVSGSLLKLLYLGFSAGPIQLGTTSFWVLYSIVPWIGVMAAGYAFGTVMTGDAAQRRRVCLRIGFSAIALFLVLRGLNLYGDPNPWSASTTAGNGQHIPALLSFLNTTKYPASFLFLLMTLGPMLVLLALAERWKGRGVDVTATFGRVPMFFYLLHIPLIHFAACLVARAREGRVDPWLFTNHPMAPPPVPEGYVWSLALLYAVWAACVVALYFPCRWYAKVRATKKAAWLSYL